MKATHVLARRRMGRHQTMKATHVLARRRMGRHQTMIVTIESPMPVDSSWQITKTVWAPEAMRVRFLIEEPTDRVRGRCHGSGRITPPHCPPPPTEGDSCMIRESTLTTLQQQVVHAVFTRNDGQPAPVDGIPVWRSADDTIVTVEPSEDGLSCTIRTTGIVTPTDSPVLVTVTADARMGADVREITGGINYTVVFDTRDEAADADFTFDAPTDR